MSKNWIAAGVAAGAMLLAPLAVAQDRGRDRSNDADMRRAIEFQRAKDRADARQERRERVHPSVNNSNADRRSEDRNKTPDPGERQWKKDKTSH